MQPPAWFVKQLQAEHEGHYRVRWSRSQHCWLIEEKSHRGRFAPPPAKPDDDDLIRANDGYRFVFAVHEQSQAPCPRCEAWVTLRPYAIGESRCERCGYSWVASWWPLDSSLLEHIRYLDPARGGLERVDRDVTRAMTQKAWAERRARHNLTEAVWKEDYNKVVGIGEFRYGGVPRYEG